MRIKMIFVSVLILILLVINSNSCIENNTEMPQENITYPISDTTFVSQIVGDSIRLDISLPSDYNNNHDKNYPIIYLTDGYWRREEHNTIHQMSDNNEIPGVIIVGIGYPENYDFNKIRVRDLIINSDKLLSWIKDEVIPYIEKKYRANIENRTLWGSSYGGYFLVYSFTEHIKQGSLFRNYICASAALNPPYVHVDLLENEKQLWESTKELPVNMYITVGSRETPSFINSYNQIVDAIKFHDYKYFRFEHDIIPDTDHYSVWKPTLLEGLRKFLGI